MTPRPLRTPLSPGAVGSTTVKYWLRGQHRAGLSRCSLPRTAMSHLASPPARAASTPPCPDSSEGAAAMAAGDCRPRPGGRRGAGVDPCT